MCEKQAQAQARLRDRSRAAGLCPNCSKPVLEGRGKCAECVRKDREYSADHRNEQSVRRTLRAARAGEYDSIVPEYEHELRIRS